MTTKSDLDLETLFNFMPDKYLILDLELKIVAFSKSYAEVTKIDPVTSIGKHVFTVFPENPSSINQDNNGIYNIQFALEQVIKEKKPNNLAIQRYDLIDPETKEYYQRYWSPSNTPIFDKAGKLIYILNRVEDVTEYLKLQTCDSDQDKHLANEIVIRAQAIQEANRKLQKNEALLRIFIESSRDYAFIMLDQDGAIINWNSGAERIKGYKAKEIIGKPYTIFYTQEAIDKHLPEQELQLARENGQYETEGYLVRKDGTLFWANTIVTPLYDEKAILLGYGKVTRDLTESRQHEEMKKEFISLVSHELRTPLTSIRGSIGLILGGAVGNASAKIKDLLQIAERNGDRLSHLINDILDFEKIESGKTNFKFVLCDLEKVINDSIITNKAYADKYEVTLVASTFKAYVNIDVGRMNQVLSNLLSNAIKFSKPGEQVYVTMTSNDDKVTIAVRDKGRGIPDEFKNKIFQKFSQADATNTRQEGGTGLGLAISQAIIKKHGGNICFDSVKDKGTVFYFDLKMMDSRHNVLNKLPQNKANHFPVLICDDDESQTEYLNLLIQEAGFRVEVCHTAEQAKKLLCENKYYALILDLILPEMSGIELIKFLRNSSSKKNQHIPIVVISIVAKEAQEVNHGIACQVIDWLEKPVDFNKLAKAFSIITADTFEKASILHVEDDFDAQNIITNLFQERAEITSVVSVAEAKALIKSAEHYDVAIIDLQLADGNGADLLPLLSAYQIPVIIFSQNQLEPKFEQYVKDVLDKTATSPEKLLISINHLLPQERNIYEGSK